MERDGKIDMLVDYFLDRMGMNEVLSLAYEQLRKNVEDMDQEEIDAEYEKYFGETLSNV